MTFAESVSRLRELLARRPDIVDRIDRGALNVRDNAAAGLPRELSDLERQLADAHVADGFESIAHEGRSHTFSAQELVARAQQYWDRHRRPGRNIRLPFAEMVFTVFIVRQLEFLGLRIWDEGISAAADRLRDLQDLLDRLNAGSATALVRDAGWLIQTAQGPLTRRLDPYFRIAQQVSVSFTNSRRLEIHRAGALLAGGHLRSQLRHRAAETGRSPDDPEVLAITRNSNSMDAALLVRDLIRLLDAYERAGDDRLQLADAIFQGVSADPELFLTRLDLLGPCTMIEALFIECSHNRHRHTSLGRTHCELLEHYSALIGQHAASLLEDAPRLDPRHAGYSTLGLAYGFCADLLSNMATDTLVSRPFFDLGLEDMLTNAGDLGKKRARADGWKATTEPGGVRTPVDYSGEWATLMFDRTVTALQARARHPDRPNATEIPCARVFIDSAPDGTPSAQEHCVTSDFQRALATGATGFPKGQIVIDRNEGRFLASAESDGRWFGVSKVVLTLFTSQGKDALLTGVPVPVVDVLRLTCRDLVGDSLDSRSRIRDDGSGISDQG